MYIYIYIYCFTDVSVVRARNKEVQDLNFSQTSSLSDVFVNETDNEEKVSKIRESLHKASSE